MGSTAKKSRKIQEKIASESSIAGAAALAEASTAAGAASGLRGGLAQKSRSLVMASIRSKGNKTTEGRMVEVLRKNHITGWRRNSSLPGKPDFVFRRERLALFVDGCFWHGCPLHFKAPRANVEFWHAKIRQNRQRDKAVSQLLRKRGWRVLRIWEHSLKRKGAWSLKRRLQAALAQHG